MKNKSWRTSLLGWVVIFYALWVAKVTYVPTNTLYFNLAYVFATPITMVLVGVALLHARDHKARD